MGDLLGGRLTPDDPPFTCVGIDFFRPFVRETRKKHLEALWMSFHLLNHASRLYRDDLVIGYGFIH